MSNNIKSSNDLSEASDKNQKKITEEKPKNEEDNNIEYDDVYVVEERPMPINEEELQDQNDEIEDISLTLSDESDEGAEIFPNDYDALKLASERAKQKVEKKEKEKKLKNLIEEKLDFKPKTIKRAEVVEDFIRNFFTQIKLTKTLDEFNQEYAELSKKGRFNDNYLGPILIFL